MWTQNLQQALLVLACPLTEIAAHASARRRTTGSGTLGQCEMMFAWGFVWQDLVPLVYFVLCVASSAPFVTILLGEIAASVWTTVRYINVGGECCECELRVL